MWLAVLALATAPPAAASPAAVPPHWLRRPTGDDVASVYPEKARRAGIAGRAELQCLEGADGRLTRCEIVGEAPAGWGFGAATLALSPKFLLSSPAQWAASNPPKINIPVSFSINGSRPPPLVTISDPTSNTPAARAGPQITQEPNWVKRPTAEDFKGVWPLAALRDGVSGKVVLSCEVNIHGVLENCRVLSETPENKGFGAAALVLTPSFLMTPASGPGGPVRSRVNIPINFKTNAGISRGFQNAPSGNFAMLTDVQWSGAPTFADLAGAYPKDGGGARGYVALRCRLSVAGAVKDCETTEENPAGKGFARAARALIRQFHAKLDPTIFKPGESIWVNIPVSFPPPASIEVQTRQISEPFWVVRVDPAKVAAVYPAQAAASGVKTGRGVAECTVQADGSLADCKPLPGNPDGMGFSESAVMVAKLMRMNIWTREGGPVDGAQIRIPIRFNLAPEIPGPSAKND